MSTLKYADVVNMEYSEMSHAQARLVICREVGLSSSPRTTFGKMDLNTIYRYLTGTFYFPKCDYYTAESPETGEVRQAVAFEAGLDYDPGPSNNRPFVLDNVRNLAETVKTRNHARRKQ